MGTGGLFPGGKAAEACNWQFTSNCWRGWQWVELYLNPSTWIYGVCMDNFMFF